MMNNVHPSMMPAPAADAGGVNGYQVGGPYHNGITNEMVNNNNR